MFNTKSLLILLIAFSCVSCASLGRKWKALVGGEPEAPTSQATAPQGPSFSSQPNMMVGKERKYKRTTKDNFADEQGLEESSGSLWRKEGQGSYLFSQNNLRMMGDIINVSVEGKAAENVDTKLSIIKQTIARIEAPPPKLGQQRQPASAASVPRPDANNQNPPPPTQVAANENENDAKKSDDKNTPQDKLKFEPVPCRIVEKNPDGSYRVKGQQTIYVGKHEYKLMVTGVLHSDDISDGVISSTKLVDSKYDLIASNKEIKNEMPH